MGSLRRAGDAAQADITTVGFHNLNLRIFNLRVSNPNKLIVDVCFDTMSDFNVPGSHCAGRYSLTRHANMLARSNSACVCSIGIYCRYGFRV